LLHAHGKERNNLPGTDAFIKKIVDKKEELDYIGSGGSNE